MYRTAVLTTSLVPTIAQSSFSWPKVADPKSILKDILAVDSFVPEVDAAIGASITPAPIPECGSKWTNIGYYVGRNEIPGIVVNRKEDCLQHWQNKLGDKEELFVNYDTETGSCYAKEYGSTPSWTEQTSTSDTAWVSIRLCAQPQDIPCVSDEDCLQHPVLWREKECPRFCLDGFCRPWDTNKKYPPILTLRTSIPVSHKDFKLREEEELERIYEKPPRFFDEKELNGKFFAVVQGAADMLEIKFPEEAFRAAKELQVEDGVVPGIAVDGFTDPKQEVERDLSIDKDDDLISDPEPWWSTYSDSGSTRTQLFEHKGRRLTAIQNQGFDRVHVTNHASYPWRMNGRLSMGCTASLIGNRVLLTAAHCVWDRDTNSWGSFPTFAAGQDGTEQPYGRKQVFRMVIPAGYMTCRTFSSCRAHDWAVLTLREDQALNVGYFGFSTLIDGQLNLAGYPQSKNRELWYDHCPLHSDEGAWIKHRCDTERGNSGSAIYKIKNGNRYVVAVHGGGYEDRWNRGADVAGRTSSAGRLFDRMLLERMMYG